MLKHTGIALMACAAAGILFAATQRFTPPEQAQDAVSTPKLRPGEWMDMRRLQGSARSSRHRDRVNAQLAELRSTRHAGGPTWSFMGPENIGGRVVDLVVDPNTPDTVYAAAASGGIWRSTDAGDTFFSVWPDDNMQSMGALTMNSAGTLYAGTGESNPGGGSLTYGNSGVFSSTDGGATWTQTGLENSERISRIVADPANPDRLFVAATGPLYNPGGERGVYRSLDGGASWSLSLAGDNETTGASDVIIDSGNPNRLYAAMWDHLREPALRRYGGVGSGLFRSDNGGDSWTRLGPANGLPDVDADIGRVSIGQAPSNPSVLYSVYLNTRGFFTASFKSIDGGDSWFQLPFDQSLAQSQSSFGWWFARIWVDPTDPDRVFVAGVPLAESTDGGNTFTNQDTIHADQHAMAWDPNVPTRVYLGNDGGVYRSETGGSAPWVFASKQAFTQFYTIDVSEADATRIVGGTQDNRCLRSYDSNGVAPVWNQYGFCGDGLENLINPDDQNIVYSCSQYGFCGVSFDGGNVSGPIGDVASERRNWQTPLAFFPGNPSTLFYAGNLVEKSTDNGLSWTTISPDLTGGDPFPSPIDPYPFGTVTTIAVSSTDENKLMIGTDGGRLWKYDGVDWTQITAPDLPERWVTKLLMPESSVDTVYLSYSGFRNADNTPYVFKTTDFGDTWIDISSNLPSAPVNALTMIPGGSLVAGGDAGVFKLNTDGSWEVYGELPLVPVTDLRMHNDSGLLFAATFGRGIWSTAVFIVDPSDTDGVPDNQDNCIFVNNADQIDTDGDGIGNACDPDFDQNCVVNFLDISAFTQAFLSNDALYDLNNDGSVNFLDYIVLSNAFLDSPGPSGIANLCP